MRGRRLKDNALSRHSSLFPSPHPKQTAHKARRECYAAALERQCSFQDTMNCDQLSSAKLQVEIVESFKIRAVEF